MGRSLKGCLQTNCTDNPSQLWCSRYLRKATQQDSRSAEGWEITSQLRCSGGFILLHVRPHQQPITKTQRSNSRALTNIWNTWTNLAKLTRAAPERKLSSNKAPNIDGVSGTANLIKPPADGVYRGLVVQNLTSGLNKRVKVTYYIVTYNSIQHNMLQYVALKAEIQMFL